MVKPKQQKLAGIILTLAILVTACTQDQMRQCAVQASRLQASIHSANAVTIKLVQAKKLAPQTALRIVEALTALNDAGDKFNTRVLEFQQRIEEANDQTEKDRLLAQARVELKPLFNDLLQLFDRFNSEGLIGIDDPETKQTIQTAIVGAQTAMTVLGGFFK